MNLSTTPLLTDLYQLTMMQTYYERGMTDTAVFEFFCRKSPESRPFYVAAGLAQLLEWLEQLRFGEEDLAWARDSGHFTEEFIDRLRDFRFTGDVHAIPEGTLCFPEEPLVRVTAPLPEAQLIESRLMNIVHFQTLIATKAARCRLAAPGKQMLDFGMRRAHGAEAALFAARATYIGGFDGTATCAAGARYGVPTAGTMAHSYIQAHEDEAAALEEFALSHPNNVVLLIDTYDTERGARRVADLAPRLAEQGIQIKGVRLDSGDLAQHARTVRQILDEADLRETKIMVSGGLDEFKLARFTNDGAPIDGYGIGSKVDTSADLPFLDCAYKLQEYAGLARRKNSEGKATWPGRKQVYREFDEHGTMRRDLVTLDGEPGAGEPQLLQVMANGQTTSPAESVSEIRDRTQRNLGKLAQAQRRLDDPEPYPVEIAEPIRALAREVDRRQNRP